MMEILVNANLHEARAAVVQNGVVQEVFLERATRRGLISNIYKGRVSRVLPGMQAAFIEIGLERTAFLHAADILDPRHTDNAIELPRPDIRALVCEGNDILVQVIKDPLGSKGARLTTYITLPSRYLVYMPQSPGVGVSARIEGETERERLRSLVQSGMDAGENAGYIVRTAAEDATHEALLADMAYLRKLWEFVRQKSLRTEAGKLVHADLPLHLRVLRDLLHPGVDRVLIDQVSVHNEMREFAATFMPAALSTLGLYAEARPLFELHQVEEEIQKALQPKVSLKSGGYVIIEQTEAMATIDVNTGAFVGHRNLEETIFRTNLEAAVAIARQLRLRNLGGIIIIDFIDMEEPEHRRQVIQALEKNLADDHVKTSISSVSPLGLVEMTRKRTRESLEHLLCQPCPTCEGRGFVKTAETVCYEVFREIV
ncbi:MAG: ribonuclease G, partial [Pseudomonadota bacterium]|nr:ribonuclease G [Pseudomonadota bacterium]